jgi:hypothetical protein
VRERERESERERKRVRERERERKKDRKKDKGEGVSSKFKIRWYQNTIFSKRIKRTPQGPQRIKRTPQGPPSPQLMYEPPKGHLFTILQDLAEERLGDIEDE